jgi:hypothetical protein
VILGWTLSGDRTSGCTGSSTNGRRPAITFGIREAALARPDGKEIAARLVAGLTGAVASVLGEQTRSGTTVELVATPEGRTGIGGAISEIAG